MRGTGIRALLSIALVFCLLLGLLPAAAETVADGALSGDYDGYIVKLRGDGAVLLSADTDAEYLGFQMYAVDTEADAYALAGADAVEFVEPNYQVELYATVNDPRYLSGGQWYLNGANGLDIEGAWDAGVTGSGVTVAVLDTGIARSHEDRPAHILTGYNATSNRPNSTNVEDVHYHGTMVSGIIAAATNNATGIAGGAYGANILPIRVFDSRGNGYLSYIIAGLDQAVSKKADVINMSLGLSEYSQSFEEAVKKAVDAGILVIAAAGNDGNATMNYPAAFDGVIGVGAIDSGGGVADYSQRNESVWVTAPGSAITSLSPGSTYSTASGTSFASPCVAALAALAVEYADAHGQSLTPGEFAALLRLTATDRGDPGYDYSYGYGTVDAPTLLAGMARQRVSYVLNGGTVDGQTTYIPYSAQSVTLATPEREDCFFAGWYESADFSGDRVASFVPADGCGARLYYAKWVENVTDLAAITLDGWAAEEQADGSWAVYLPAGTALPAGADCVSVTFAFTGDSPALDYTVEDRGGGTWAITVTQDSTYSCTYTLTADNTSCHAPGAVRSDVTATAAPASLDGATAAVAYEADVSGWFFDVDGEELSYALSGDAETVGLTLEGSRLTYTPPAVAAGTEVAFSVTAGDGRFASQPVAVRVQVAALPVSAPVLSATQGSYRADAPADVVVGFTAYDNALSAVTVDGAALTEGTDYAVYTGPVIDDDTQADALTGGEGGYATYVVLKADYLDTLFSGQYQVVFHFATGRSEPPELTVSYTLEAATHSGVLTGDLLWHYSTGQVTLSGTPPDGATVYVAAYGEGGGLERVGVLSGPGQVGLPQGQGVTYRIFCWNDSLMPLCSAVEVAP